MNLSGISKIWRADASITDTEYGNAMGLLLDQKRNYHIEQAPTGSASKLYRICGDARVLSLHAP